MKELKKELLKPIKINFMIIFTIMVYRLFKSPLGPTLANAFLCHYEKEWLNSGPIEFKPKLYKRYVADIFVMFRSRNHIKKFVDYMNTKHPNIRFTFEIADQNSFSFLDTKIIRNTEEKAFETSIYRKSAFIGVFTNFKSFIPMTCYFAVFQYALPMKSFTRKLSSSKKSLSEILTQKNL